MTRDEIQQLSEGAPPWQIRPGWDCAMVIEYLSKNWLIMADRYEKMKTKYEFLHATIDDVY